MKPSHPGPSPLTVAEAARRLREGEVLAYPTESVFGLGCNPADEQALTKLLSLKRREPGKGLILIAFEYAQIEPYLAPLSQARTDTMLASWPGPVTWLAPARAGISRLLRGEHDSIAVRVTAHPIASALCREAQMAIVSTSANRSGQPPAKTADAVRAAFGDSVSCIVEGSVGGAVSPTEIRDLISGQLVRA